MLQKKKTLNRKYQKKESIRTKLRHCKLSFKPLDSSPDKSIHNIPGEQPMDREGAVLLNMLEKLIGP